MSDEEWACFEPFVTVRGAHSGRPPKDHRLVLDGIFWLARTGAQWRDLHEHFGKWSSVYRQFRRWTLGGLWELLLEALNETEGAGESVQMIDSTIIRAHHCAAGAKRGTPRQGLGRSRGGFTTKIHLRTNGEGLPIAVEVTGGDVSDYSGFAPLMEAEGPEAKVLLADRGYDADHIRKTMEQRGAATVIPTRKNRKVQLPVDGYIYALRNRIERCFNKLKNSRRLATRYDKTAQSYLGFVRIAAIRLWMREFVNRT
ncbi:IS5 family transposase [Rhodomicrobium lacus]|uniref:IS5 family transposase n=1 Tax=Rhodomicrobium lacus TaxID=2498452 RepID=UPI0026E44B49|nr:IS5 family transposase [Rhodomicrobium lacus]WKW52479.1 IS5 family transposase [Rhodomicrobium lacus]